MAIAPNATETLFSPGGGTVNRQSIASLIGRQPHGRSLLQSFYLSPEIYALDIERVLRRHWHCVGHVSAIPRVGDYLLFEFDRDSAIVIRGEDGEIRALSNVCRHRGSRLCNEQAGLAKVLVCPYHAWSYRLDGSLRKVPKAPEGFDSSQYRLKAFPVKVIAGLIFVSVSDDPLSLNEVEKSLNAALGTFEWGKAKIAHQERYLINANWKLALENQVECYHCLPSHPEFSKVHAMGHKGSEGEGAVRSVHDQWALNSRGGEEQDFWSENAMQGAAVSASEDGTAVGMAMGPACTYDGTFRVAYAGPLNHFLGYADYGAIFRYTPRSVLETEFAVTWLVNSEAQEGVDYDKDRLIWMWRITAGADKRIVEGNQKGVSSRTYEPGPYVLPIESKTLRFTEWYLSALEEAIT